ncbi:MAG TPA: polyprenyl synthetase family protein, partial [Acidimicrobiales bacterium]|nr:polyprenyl synthetase family protein [Acidimicrobiales bacterium]
MAVRMGPDSLGWIGGRVEARIEELLESEVERWAALDVDLLEPLRALQRLIRAGGKRLRPAFCHWAFVAAGGDPEAQLVVDAGAALELLHTFALIHDDVMDGSVRRRGKDTVHLTFESRHAEGAWR